MWLEGVVLVVHARHSDVEGGEWTSGRCWLVEVGGRAFEGVLRWRVEEGVELCKHGGLV